MKGPVGGETLKCIAEHVKCATKSVALKIDGVAKSPAEFFFLPRRSGEVRRGLKTVFATFCDGVKIRGDTEGLKKRNSQTRSNPPRQ